MSGLPAQTLGVEDRGLLRQGGKADILIFDVNEIIDRATFEHPHELAEGFNWIMVKGMLVREEGKFTGKSAGRVLKRK
jgi:N-acyl-D-aspartate/D-glutamate deacylase